MTIEGTNPRKAAARVRQARPVSKSTVFVVGVLLVQAGSAFFFVSDIFSSYFGLRTVPLDWQIRELIEIGAAVGLVLGLALGALVLRRTMARTRVVEQQLRAASGAFMDLLNERFDAWGLTPAERDVALFAIKGLSTQDIAQMRATSEGTVKAQTNAIYRKAGVTGRPQLLSMFIDDLMDGDLGDRGAEAMVPLARVVGR